MDSLNNTTNNLQTSSSINKYWCFMCEAEFSKASDSSTEVFCPTCNCISELIDVSNDPRSFKPYDAQNENRSNNSQPISSGVNNNAPTIQNNTAQSNTQIPQNVIVSGINIVSQVIQSPLGRVVIQTTSPAGIPFPPNQNQNQGQAVNQPQPQPQGPVHIQAVNQQPSLNSIGNLIGGFLGGNPFTNVFNPMFGGFGGQGNNVFADLESRIIEEFLRNDPNRHGPPPASEEMINRLKKVKYNTGNNGVCKSKDCTVCQEDFKNDEVLIKMPCEHCFHKDCVTKWLSMHNSCPVCRKALNEPEPAVPDYIA